MDLTGWTYLFEFGDSLYVYGKDNERAGVNKDGKVVMYYKVGPDHNPRCEECIAARVGNNNLNKKEVLRCGDSTS